MINTLANLRFVFISKVLVPVQIVQIVFNGFLKACNIDGRNAAPVQRS